MLENNFEDDEVEDNNIENYIEDNEENEVENNNIVDNDIEEHKNMRILIRKMKLEDNEMEKYNFEKKKKIL